MIPDIKELNFPKIDGKQYATLTQATANIADMGEKTITTQVKIDGEIVPDFSFDWEVEFQGEKYIMPLRMPQGAKENTSLNSTIDLAFQHWAIYQLKRFNFTTIQQIAAGTYLPDEEVATVQLNLGDFCKLFGQVLEYYYGDAITIDFNDDPVTGWKYTQEATIITISHTTIWNVLINTFHDKYGVRWEIIPASDNSNTVKGGERYVIRVGYPTTEIDHIFEYGFEGGLLKVERQVQSEEIRNIIKGRGGDTNIPLRYFKNTDPNNPDFRPDPDWVEELANIPFTNLMPATFRSYVQGWKAAHISKYPGYTAVGESNAYAPWAYRKGATDTKFAPVEFVADEITINPATGDKQVEILPGYSPYVKKGSSLDKYGPLPDTLDNNDDIYPTLQGTGLDIAVAVEQIESDDVEESAENDAKITNIPDGERKYVFRNVAPSASATKTLDRINFTVESGKHANFIDDARILKAVIPGRGGGRGTNARPVDIATNTEYSVTVYVYNASTGEQHSASGIPAGDWYCEISVTVRNISQDHLNITVGTETPKLESATIDDDRWRNTFDIWVKNIWDTKKGISEDGTAITGETDEEYAERVWKPVLGDREGDTAKVVFTSGALALSEDYEFTIVDFPVPDTSETWEEKDDNGIVIATHTSHWRIKLAKSEAELEATGLYVPSTKKQGKAGDTFVFIGTEMTHVPYVVDAEERLDDWKKDQLGEKKEIKPTAVVTTDRVRLNNEGKPNALINQLRVGNSMRLFDKRFFNEEGKEYETLYLQSITYTYREPSSNDAALNPDVQIVLGNEYTTSANPVSMMQGEISALKKQLRSISNVEQIVRAVGDRLYLRKDGISDRSLSPTQFFSLLTSGDFRAGLVGGAGWGFYKDENGNWVLEADRVNVRQEMSVNTLVINQAEGRGGMEIDTAAFMEVVRVTETDAGYACYFDQKDGSVANLFHVDDVAFCNQWTPDNAQLKFYKRRVVAVGADSITLSKTDVNGTGVPAEGDNIIHFGNYTDATRQYVKVRDVVGGGYERYIEALNSVNAAGVEYYFVGKQAGQSRWFVGNKDLVPYSGAGDGSYIEYINRKFNLNNVSLSVNTTIGDKTLEEYIKLVSPPVEQEDIEGFVNAIVDPKLEGIQDQIDGVIETWFYNGVPTLSNYPASGWNTPDLKIQHLGDLYYDNDTGTAYRFSQNADGGYYWNTITDDAITKALAAAQKAQDTANNKRRIFVQQPTPPYDKGDLWVNATYGTQYTNDILRCVTAKASGAAFAIGDWTLASKYTDDTLAQAAKEAADNAQADATAAKTRLDQWAADGTISPTEKQAIKDEIARIDADKAHISAEYTRYGLGTPSSYYGAHEAYRTQLVSLSAATPENIPIPSSFATNQTAYYNARTSSLSLIAKAAKEYAEKVAEDSVAGYKYLKEAIVNGVTQFQGGLMMSSLIRLGAWNADKTAMTKVYAGMNGVYANGRTIASWWGGDMVDLFDANDNLINPAPDNAATSLVRMDGTGYFVDGLFRIKKTGLEIGDTVNGYGISMGMDGRLTLGNGIEINIGGDAKGLGESIKSVTNLANTLSDLFTPFNGNAEETWKRIIEGKATYDSVRVNAGLWTNKFLSCLGLNSSGSGGGGGGFGLMREWPATAPLPTTNDALGANLGYDLWLNKADKSTVNAIASRVTTLEGKNYLDALTLVPSGSGNTVAAVSLSADKKTLNVNYANRVLAAPSISGTMNSLTAFGNALGMINLQSASALVNPNGQTGWHHFINVSFAVSGQETNMWQTQIANAAGTTDLWVRSRAGGTISDSTAWAAPWTRILTGTNYASVLDARYYTKSEVDTKNKRLTTYYAVRPTSANVNFGNAAGLYTFLATSVMTTGKPAVDSHILHMEWDNSLAYAAQLALPAGVDASMQWRWQHYTTWQAWRTLLDTNNYAGTLDARYVTLNTAQMITGVKTFVGGNLKVAGNSANYMPVLRSTNEAIPTSARDYAWQFYHWAQDGENRGLSIWSYDGDSKVYNHVATFKAHPWNSLVVNGPIARHDGTASQFLMADGSLASKHTLTTINNLGWNGTQGQVATINTIAFWNGQYASGASNLQYCDRGRFGDIVTHSHSEYVTALGTSGNYLTWTKNGVANNITVPYATKTRLLEEATGLARGDNDSSVEIPSSLPAGIRVRFKNGTGAASAYYWNTIVDLTAFSGSSGSGAGHRNQFLFSNSSANPDGSFWVRNGVDSTWHPWRLVLTDSNYSSVLDNRYYTESEADARFVNASGDTMGGVLTINVDVNAPVLQLNQTSGKEPYMYLRRSGINKAAFTHQTTYGASIFSEASQKYLGIKDDGTPHFHGSTLLHAGNYASFLDSVYVKKAGDTMTGALLAPRVEVGHIYWDGTGIMPSTAGHLQYVCGKADGRWANVFTRTINVTSTDLVSNLNADMLDGRHASTFVSSTGTAFLNQHNAGVWMKILTFTITSGALNPTIAFTYYPTECNRERWVDLSINIRANNIVFHKSLKGNEEVNMKCVGNGTTFDVWMQCNKSTYDGYGMLTHKANAFITSYSYGRLAFQDTEPTGTYSKIADISGIVFAAQRLRTARTINGTSFNGETNIVTSYWGATRTLWGQSCNGSGNVDGTIRVRFSGSGNYTEGIRLYGTAKDGTWSNINFGCDPASDNNTHANQWILGRNASNNFVLDVNGSAGKIMTWQKGGNVGIGTTSPAYKLDVNGIVRASDSIISTGWNQFRAVCGNYGFFIRNDGNHTYFMLTNSGDAYGSYNSLRPMYIVNSSGVVGFASSTLMVDPDGYASVNGEFYASVGIYSDGFVSARGRNTSDVRLKTDLCDFRASDIIRSLRPVAFRWNELARNRYRVFDTDAVQYGLIAQEVMEVAPWLVDADMFKDGYMGVWYDKLIPVLLKGEIELLRVTDDHEERIKALEQENEELRKEIIELQTR